MNTVFTFSRAIEPMKLAGKVSQVVLTTVGLFLVVGCGTVQHRVDLENKYLPSKDTQIEVGPVANETGETFDIDVEKLFADALADTLKKENLIWDGKDGTPHLVITSKIVEYEKGNAFKRWLMPGWGSTELVIECDLSNEGLSVGQARANRSVAFGGGFTIGAWETIFADIAEDMVADLKSKLKK